MTFRHLTLFVALSCSAATPAYTSPVTLRFQGTADLSAFGASAASTFSGAVTWDETSWPSSLGDDYARYLIDGQPESVRATLTINGVDYSDRIEPWSRFEQLPYELFLEYYFEPLLDLDGGPAQDVTSAYLLLWSDRHQDAEDPVFPDAYPLPANLLFLRELERQRFAFRGDDTGWYPGVQADTLFVPEPSLLMLVAGASVAASIARRRTKH